MSPIISVQFLWRTRRTSVFVSYGQAFSDENVFVRRHRLPAPPAGHMPTTSHSLPWFLLSQGRALCAVAVACSLVLVLLARALCRSRRLHSVRRPSLPLPLSVRATDDTLVRPGSRIRPAPLRRRAAGRSLRGWRRPSRPLRSRPPPAAQAPPRCPTPQGSRSDS